MQTLNRENFNKNRYPTKIMQFGEGNFLRAFVDWQIDILNETTELNAGIAIIRPIDYDALPLLNVQDGLYTSIIRGLNEQGDVVADHRIISSVNEEIPVYKEFAKYMALAESPDLKIIFSNTTEAGIEYIDTDKLTDAPAKAFPAKLTQWLYHRFEFFSGSKDSGVVIIPCELIDYNGDKLKEIVLQYCQLWQLSDEFINWLITANDFCSTLVDRIVTGFPRDEHAKLQEELGYKDNFMVTAEYFHLFVIQGPEHLADLLCLEGSELNIKVVDDISPYKQRKVAILNGAHTAMVPLAYMSDIDSVGEALADPLFEKYLTALIFDEIIPTLNLPKDELEAFANDGDRNACVTQSFAARPISCQQNDVNIEAAFRKILCQQTQLFLGTTAVHRGDYQCNTNRHDTAPNEESPGLDNRSRRINSSSRMNSSIASP